MSIQVTIIVLTYNPDYKKLMATLKSAINQKGISYEIIISDDGSERDYFTEIEEYLKDSRVKYYSLIKNKKNIGTINNLLGAVKESKGEYIVGISPGDYLFSNDTVRQFFEIASREHMDICFGDYIPYYVDNNEAKIASNIDYAPQKTKPFKMKFPYYKQYVILGNNILGASFFRSREFFLEGLQYISNAVRYLEDASISAYALSKNIPIYYVPIKLTWYECNTGISTSGDSKWLNLLEKDFKNTFDKIGKDFPNDRVVKAKMMSDRLRGSKMRPIILALCFPVLSYRKLRMSFLPNRIVECSDEDKKYLYELLN